VAKTPECPICGKPTQADTKPFCSLRCKDVDLNRWFSGSYAVAEVESDDESDIEDDKDHKEFQ
jgi:uncharacterized protein